MDYGGYGGYGGWWVWNGGWWVRMIKGPCDDDDDGLRKKSQSIFPIRGCVMRIKLMFLDSACCATSVRVGSMCMCKRAGLYEQIFFFVGWHGWVSIYIST